MPTTIQQIKQALELTDFDVEFAQRKMTPASRALVRPQETSGTARLGGVLLLLYYRNDDLFVLLTKRREDLASHAGQISFPGGRHEAPETLLATALRETEEEVGIAAADVVILGSLAPIYVPPSDYEVHPYVAWFSNGKCPVFDPAPGEVAEIIEVPLATLLDPSTCMEETWEFGSRNVVVPFFAVGENKIWGATAVMLSEFVERVRVIVA